MLPKLTAFAFLFISLSVMAGWEANFALSDSHVLPPSRAKDIVRQCSRAAPENFSEAWKPSIEQIGALERALVVYLEQREKNGEPVPPKDRTYHRQYVGIVVNGNHIIYGNFYPLREPRSSESSAPVLACDGGPVFWGIVFNPKTGVFEDLQFNGHI